jgi:hypothetical protein
MLGSPPKKHEALSSNSSTAPSKKNGNYPY